MNQLLNKQHGFMILSLSGFYTTNFLLAKHAELHRVNSVQLLLSIALSGLFYPKLTITLVTLLSGLRVTQSYTQLISPSQAKLADQGLRMSLMFLGLFAPFRTFMLGKHM